MKSSKYEIDFNEPVVLGKLQQQVYIRGRKRSNPFLLVLHGGLGTCESPLAHHYGGVLEHHFNMVHWDQRGRNRSYHASIPKESMTIEQVLNDACELISWIQTQYSQDKIFLVGHSWGSLLGMLIAQKVPEAIYAFIGLGQLVSLARNETLSYQFTLQRARELGVSDAIHQLEAMGPPPFKKTYDVLTQRSWLTKFGGLLYQERSMDKIFSVMAKAPSGYEFTESRDPGGHFSLHAIWPELEKRDLFVEVPRVNVPVSIYMGRHDYCTVQSVAHDYYQKLEAPSGKKWEWFEKSAHWPHIEETDKFTSSLLRDFTL